MLLSSVNDSFTTQIGLHRISALDDSAEIDIAAREKRKEGLEKGTTAEFGEERDTKPIQNQFVFVDASLALHSQRPKIVLLSPGTRPAKIDEAGDCPL